MTESTSNNTFTNLGRSFQEKVVQAMIFDRSWASTFVEVFQIDECLEYADLKLLANKYIEHYRAYKEFPSLQLLMSVVKEEYKNSLDTSLKDRMIIFLKKVATNSELGDLDWVKDKAFSFCRQQQMKKALLEAAEIASDESKYELINSMMKNAISAGIPVSEGLNYADDIDARYSTTYRRCVSTGWQPIDDRKILNGGLGEGEIGIVVAATGGGKSHLLVDLGCAALKQGKNVLHYTLELNERMIGIRYDSNLLGISSTDCPDNREAIKDFFQLNAHCLGKLRIKQLQGKMSSINTIRSHVEKLKLKNFFPDLIIIDYAGIMRSTIKYDMLRLELAQVIQEIRDYAVELGVPIWTALQSNKAGSQSDIIDLSNMAESYAQAAIADFVLGLTRKSENKSTGLGTLFVAKNRAGMDGLQFTIMLDTSQSRLTFLSEGEQPETEELKREITQRADKGDSFKQTMKKNNDFFKKV